MRHVEIPRLSTYVFVLHFRGPTTIGTSVHIGPNVQVFAVIEPVGALNRDLALRSLKYSVILNNLTRVLGV